MKPEASGKFIIILDANTWKIQIKDRSRKLFVTYHECTLNIKRNKTIANMLWLDKKARVPVLLSNFKARIITNDKNACFVIIKNWIYVS